MRPLRIFIILLLFLVFFTGLSYLIPGVIKLPGIEVFFPKSFLNKGSDLVANQSDKPDTLQSLLVTKVDSTLNNTKPVLIEDSITWNQSLNLSYFIDSLVSLGKQVRIMYYGDSQLEGDRITSYLRNSLQKSFGGTGPGLLLPLMPVMYTKSVYVSSSSNWKRYNWLSYKDGEIISPELGPFMTFCRYLIPAEKLEQPEKAYVTIRPSSLADSSASVYDKMRMFYGNLSDTVLVRVIAGTDLIISDTLQIGGGPFQFEASLKNRSEVTIEFTGKVSPDVYGISIESDTGVIVDNIPQRGSAGLEFTMVNEANLDSVNKFLNPDLFILQYGLNIVRNVRKDYSYYENGLYRQISLIKKMCPGAKILVLSLTDMAFVENDTIKSFPNIEAIRDAQRNAAKRADVYFWDAYKEMGGENSIVKWANSIPPLAQSDYTHFTYTGADSISDLLTNWLIKDTGNKLQNISEANAIDSLIAPIGSVVKTAVEQRILPSKLHFFIKRVFNYNPGSPFIFTSPAFWIFFLFVLAIYSLIYKKLFIRNFFLFLVSLFFYYKTGGLFLSLLMFVIIVDFSVGLLISRTEKRYKRRFYLLISLLSNLGILAWFKYTAFFVTSINTLFGTDLVVRNIFSEIANNWLGTSFDISSIILPVGISFFTFQSISYTIDVYRKKVEPVKNIIDFGFYVSFFPQLVAGPIVRASEFIPQIYMKYSLSKREFGHALFLILKGLIKKIIISDFIAANFVDRVFDGPQFFSGFENLAAVYGYGLQIYCDFSGYTDIAIGLGLLLGFRLPINFNSPYKADSIYDFWKRWHISLSRWLKDYLYIPLGGNRHGKFRTYLNLFITMLLGGLWHGASLRFVIWGGLHGIGLTINKAFSSIFPSGIFKGRFGRAVAVFITFQFVSFCWLFFRVDGIDKIVLILKQITENFSPGSYMEVIPAYGKVFFLILTGYTIHLLPENIKESYRGLFIRFPLVLKMAVVLIVAIMLYQMTGSKIEPFIYFRF